MRYKIIEIYFVLTEYVLKQLYFTEKEGKFDIASLK